MRALAVDVVSLYDFALPDATAVELPAPGNAGAAQEWSDSFNWLFYGHTLPHVARCELAPLQCDSAFKSIAGRWDGSSKSSSVLLSPRYRAGVFTAWLHFEAKGSRSLDDVRTDIKNNRDLQLDSGVYDALEDLNIEFPESERHYRLVAVRTDATVENFASVLADARESAGRLFTGGREHETRAFLEGLVDDGENLSHRNYERFFLRWTDALALYVNDVEKSPSYRDRDYTLAVLRCAHLFQTCVMVRRILRNLDDDMTKLSEGMRIGVRHFRPPFSETAEALGVFSDAERDFKIAPPFRSVEGETMVKAGYKKFGIFELFDATRMSYTRLDDRRRWVTTQLSIAIPFLLTTLVGILGVVATLVTS
jgi:hypothetical protein